MAQPKPNAAMKKPCASTKPNHKAHAKDHLEQILESSRTLAMLADFLACCQADIVHPQTINQAGLLLWLEAEKMQQLHRQLPKFQALG